MSADVTPNGEQVILRMPAETKEAIRLAATIQGKTVTTFIIDAAMKQLVSTAERDCREVQAGNRALYLTVGEVHELSGYSMNCKQIEWLRKNGIHHFVRADGRPMVHVTAIESPKPGEPKNKKWEPNFDAVRAAPRHVKAERPKRDATDEMLRRQRR